MEILLLVLILLGTCDSDEEPLFCEVDCHDATGVGGDAGAGGEGGAGGATSTSSAGEGGHGGDDGQGGAGGSGGTPCEPSAAACGEAVCGEAPDGCDGTVTCGACEAGERCVDGACCQPATCEPGRCGVHDDGCGGVINCGDICGDGSGWMTCSEAGWCECTSAAEIPRGDAAEADCQAAGTGHAFACGEPRDDEGKLYDDAPGGCEYVPTTIGVDGPRLWCCP